MTLSVRIKVLKNLLLLAVSLWSWSHAHAEVTASFSAPSSTAGDFMPGRVLVGVRRDGQLGQAAESSALRLDLPGVQVLGSAGSAVVVLNITDGTSVHRKVEELKQLPGVLFAEPDYVVYAHQATPSPPGGHKFSGLWDLVRVQAPAAWHSYTGDADLGVCVIDTGVDYLHAHLAPNIHPTLRYNALLKTNDPMDDNGHGTHCAGIIGALWDNNTGVVGVNWQVKIIPCKFMTYRGTGAVSDALSCVSWCRMNGVRILSNSWGFRAYSQALYEEIKSVQDAGGLFVASAGNTNSDDDALPTYPASYDLDAVLSVAATDGGDNRAMFSSFGRTSVDLAAPGSGIWSTLPANRYAPLSGTSMSAALVSGSAALLLGASNGSSSSAQLKSMMLQTVDPVAALTGVTVSEGRLNLYQAMQRVRGSSTPIPPQPPLSGRTACNLTLFADYIWKGPSVSSGAEWDSRQGGYCWQVDDLAQQGFAKRANSVSFICRCPDSDCGSIHSGTSYALFSSALSVNEGTSALWFDLQPTTTFCNSTTCGSLLPWFSADWRREVSAIRFCFGGKPLFTKHMTSAGSFASTPGQAVLNLALDGHLPQLGHVQQWDWSLLPAGQELEGMVSF